MARRGRSQTHFLCPLTLRSVSDCESWAHGPAACSTHAQVTSHVELVGLRPTDDLQKGTPLVS